VNATDKPCDCPAYDPELGWHTTADHEQDCGHTAPGMSCGGCWGCRAAQVAYHQVLASRGGAA
jgi:hypothetical protein